MKKFRGYGINVLRVWAQWDSAIGRLPQGNPVAPEKFNKPVVDDEPARIGTSNYGGPREPTFPMDHILSIYNVWRVGGHPTYHHDMFQTGYGTPSVPPSGIPDPEFSPYHRQVFEFLKLRDRYSGT